MSVVGRGGIVPGEHHSPTLLLYSEEQLYTTLYTTSLMLTPPPPCFYEHLYVQLSPTLYGLFFTGNHRQEITDTYLFDYLIIYLFAYAFI